MTAKTTRTKVLVMVMTYPHPSATYQELVCTAGITEDGEWVRLYPIPYRYLSSEQMFRKYQWIEIDLQARGARNDPRKESCQPVVDSIQVLGSPIPTGDGWRARRKSSVHGGKRPRTRTPGAITRLPSISPGPNMSRRREGANGGFPPRRRTARWSGRAPHRNDPRRHDT